MSGTQPVGVYAMKVPPGDILLPAVPDFAAMFRVSMAAIDPAEEPMYDDENDKKPPRAILKIVRFPGDMFDEDSEEDEDDDDDDLLNGLGGDSDSDSDEESDEEEVNGGPSDPKKSKLAKLKVEGSDDDEDMEDMSDDDAEAMAALKKIMKKAKGKGKAEDDDDDDEDEEDDDSDLDDDDPLELEEVVLCTLDLEKNYQQTLDFVVGEDERVFFKVTGTHTVHLTGNYVIPMDDGQAQLYDDDDEEAEEYDLSPDEDELLALEAEDDEEDELDDLEDPRITEVDDEEEAPKFIKPAGKGKNKRPAEESADDDSEANLDELMAKSLKKEEATPVTNGETKKLSKAEKKRQKKLKRNDGEAAPVLGLDGASSQTKDVKKTEAPTNGASFEKKVQFAKNLEQGPTPSATLPSKAENKDTTTKTTGSLGVKEVQGVTIDDRKLGNGPAAKKGSKVEMRYIGKLESGKIFDSNKKGKPFSFKLGNGEVIKGWDIGVEGMSAGSERRLTIPAHHGYGKKGAPPDIPPNSKLIFDIKCIGVQ